MNFMCECVDILTALSCAVVSECSRTMILDASLGSATWGSLTSPLRQSSESWECPIPTLFVFLAALIDCKTNYSGIIQAIQLCLR